MFFYFRKFNINVISIYFEKFYFNEFYDSSNNLFETMRPILKFFHVLNTIFYKKMIENILIKVP